MHQQDVIQDRFSNQTPIYCEWVISPSLVNGVMCRIHAASVLHMSHMLVHCPGGLRDARIIGDVMELSLYLAAACHDYEHPGLNNDFLVKSHHTWAMCHNDKSPLENHHASAALMVLCQHLQSFMCKVRIVLCKMTCRQIVAGMLKEYAIAWHMHFTCNTCWTWRAVRIIQRSRDWGLRSCIYSFPLSHQCWIQSRCTWPILLCRRVVRNFLHKVGLKHGYALCLLVQNQLLLSVLPKPRRPQTWRILEEDQLFHGISAQCAIHHMQSVFPLRHSFGCIWQSLYGEHALASQKGHRQRLAMYVSASYRITDDMSCTTVCALRLYVTRLLITCYAKHLGYRSVRDMKSINAGHLWHACYICLLCGKPYCKTIWNIGTIHVLFEQGSFWLESQLLKFFSAAWSRICWLS